MNTKRWMLEDAIRTALLTKDRNVAETGLSLYCWQSVRQDGRDLDQSASRRTQTHQGLSGERQSKSVQR